jgi:two-component system response regulator MprA
MTREQRAAGERTGAQPAARVLVAEDDRKIAAFLERALTYEGYQVRLAADGPSALVMAAASDPEVVVLDVMLPGLDGLSVARQLRARGGVPILMLTARETVNDRVLGLDAGADDYLTKPFALDELLARLRALLRRRAIDAAAEHQHQGILAFADVEVDLDAHLAKRDGMALELRNKEFELLVYFLHNPGRVASRRQILEDVWGYDFLGDSNVIEVTIARLRQKLEADARPRILHTVQRVGYVLRLQLRPMEQS